MSSLSLNKGPVEKRPLWGLCARQAGFGKLARGRWAVTWSRSGQGPRVRGDTLLILSAPCFCGRDAPGVCGWEPAAATLQVAGAVGVAGRAVGSGAPRPCGCSAPASPVRTPSLAWSEAVGPPLRSDHSDRSDRARPGRGSGPSRHRLAPVSGDTAFVIVALG